MIGALAALTGGASGQTPAGGRASGTISRMDTVEIRVFREEE